MDSQTERDNNSRTARGPLRCQITTSSAQIEAGTEFTIFLQITNPYEVVVKLTNTTMRLPGEFSDLQGIARKQERDQLYKAIQDSLKNSNRDREQSSSHTLDKESLLRFLSDVTSVMLRSGVLGVVFPSVVTDGLVTAVSLSQKKSPAEEVAELVNPELLAEIEKIRSDPNLAEEHQRREVAQLLAARARALEQLPQVTLQSGDTAVQSFTLRTNRAILFTPSTYNIHLQVEYEVDAIPHRDAIEYRMNIRAPLSALITGAALGSIAGYMLRDIFENRGLMNVMASPSVVGVLSWFVTLIGNILLGVVTVIAFARKKDTQPVLSIEDFWGGVFIGILGGYLGKSLLDHFLTTQGLATGTPAPPATPLPSGSGTPR